MTRWLFPMVVLTLLATALTLGLWVGRPDLLSDPLPVHWDINGKVDGTVPLDHAGVYLFLSPGVMVLMIVLTLVLPWLSPKNFSLERSGDTYGYVMFLGTALFGYLHLAILWSCLKDPPMRFDIGQLFVGGMFLFFALMGNVMGKLKPTFYVGVRTPWTLSSEAVWTGTHRLAAWLWVGGGVLGLIALLCGAPLWALFVYFMIIVLAPVPYSLLLYKRLEREGRLQPAPK